VGCASKRVSGGTVSGKIHYKGQPVNGVTLHLHSDKPGNIPISVDQEGKFNTSGIAPGEYKVVVEPGRPSAGPGRGMTSEPPKGMDPEKAAKWKEKMGEMGGQAQAAPTIAFPNKYKNLATTDLKCTVTEGQQTLDLELKD
jgi:hypothetical protein